MRATLIISGPRGLVTLKANLAHPMRLGSSSNHCSIQIADILAGATADVIRKDQEMDFKQLGAAISPLLHEDSVLPDPAICNIPAFLNRLALRELAQGTLQGAHPYQDMDIFL
ncbi:hypothetical protein [Rhizobium leguminosarum]|uniref:hypothetical protein n=1 Tax=Rhizobium leguminosarum TaxID=384 RepID=UPI000517EC87|nr:hypothetical protein [Rhizobium leguminosarum]